MFWLRFALRSCLRRRRRTGITLLGMAFAIGTLVVLGAIMVGVNDTMIQNAVAMHAGHVAGVAGPMRMAEAMRRVRTVGEGPPDAAVAGQLRRCRFTAMLQSDRATAPTTIWAVAPEQESEFTPIRRSVREGGYFERPSDLVIGAGCARELSLKVGDVVLLTTPSEHREFRVGGIFDTGIDRFDAGVSFMTLTAAADLNEPQVYFERAFFLEPGSEAVETREGIATTAQVDERVSTWPELLPEVAQLVDLNTFSMTIMTTLVVLILGFGLANALLISVMDRYRHFAVLKAIGVRPGEVARVILFEALLMCLAASLLGTGLGAAASLVWGHYGLDLSAYTSSNPHFSVNPVVYPRLTAMTMFAPQALALCAAALAAVWPAIVAASRPVSLAMREA